MSEQRRELLKLLLQIERHCPCGARPEASDFPHSIGCPVAKALDLLAASPVATDGWQPSREQLATIFEQAWRDWNGRDRIFDVLADAVLLKWPAPPADAPQEKG